MAAVVARPADMLEVAAFEELVREHQKRVFRLALRLLGDAEEAATATQDCFLRAFTALERCPAEAEARQRWMARLATNLCLDRLRSRKWMWWRRRRGLERPDLDQESARLSLLARSPERELLAREIGDRLVLALRRLSARQRAVFVLRHYEDYSLEQIAEHLAMPVGTVKSHLNRALSHLRRELREFYDPRGFASG